MKGRRDREGKEAKLLIYVRAKEINSSPVAKGPRSGQRGGQEFSTAVGS